MSRLAPPPPQPARAPEPRQSGSRRGGGSAARHRLAGAVVLCLAIAAAGLIAARPDRFSDTQTVRAVFDAAANLGPLEVEVRVAGTPVGRVTGVRRQGDDAVLEMVVERGAGRLRADARAEIRPRATFEGTAFVELRPGVSERPLGGRAIPRSQTRSYVSIAEALSVLRPRARDDVRANARAARRVLAPAGSDGLREALRQAPRLTRSGALAARAAQGPRGDELSGAVRGLAATAAGVAREEARLGPLLTGADRTAAGLSTDGGGALDRTLADLPTRLVAVERGSRVVSGLLGEIEPLAAELEPGARELAPTLRAARPLLRETRPVLTEAPPVVAALRQTLAAAATSAPEARRLVRAAAPSLRLVEGSILPALAAESDLGLPVYLQLLSAGQGADGALRPLQRGGDSPGGEAGHYLRTSGRPVPAAGLPVSCGALADADPELARLLAAAGACTP